MLNERKQLNAVRKGRGGFTLLELIIVMAVVVSLLGLVAPTLRNTFKQRGLNDEAVRLLALTEYARNEAVSQGIPTQVWIDPLSGNYGAEAMPGYDGDKAGPVAATGPSTQSAVISGVEAKEYSLGADDHFEVAKSTHVTSRGYTQVIQFDPDGSPTQGTGIDYIRIIDKDNRTVSLGLATDGWAYQIQDPNSQGGSR